MALEEYRSKRDFAKTPEPGGAAAAAAPHESAPPAPGGRPEGGAPAAGRLYVIQKHAATRLHYDFRLELDGVLLSWAIPKGPSLDPHDRRLAARTEDHPVEYGSFEGTIPAGEYGGGTVLLWDRGTWEPEGDPQAMLAKGDLKFTLHGEKLRGSWVLVRMKPRPGRGSHEEWLLIKHRDDEAVSAGPEGAAPAAGTAAGSGAGAKAGAAASAGDRLLVERPESVASGRSMEQITASGTASLWHSDQPAAAQTGVRPGEDFALEPAAVAGATPAPVPRFVLPELATLVKAAPAGGDWIHEIKLDGYRAIARVENGSAWMYSRNDNDWTDQFRVIADELAALPVKSAVLDGEVVVLLPDGRSSFEALKDAIGAPRSRPLGPEGAAGPLVYFAFDLLHLDGYDLTGAAIEDRRDLLYRLLARVGQGGHVRFSDHVAGGGSDVYQQACALGLEGIVSKRAGSPYRPGTRSGEWLKSKCTNRQEFVVGGYTDPGGTRTGFGALLLGVQQADGLRYVGRVGTGFNEKSIGALASRLDSLRTEAPPFTSDLDRAPKKAHWVRPDLVAEVEFAEWTREGGLRHPSFKGLREDKPAGEVVAEEPVGAAPEAAAAPPAAAPSGASPVGASSSATVTITHADRVFWPTPGITKADLVRYYDLVAARMLPYVINRPVSMVRCPSGVESGGAAQRQQRGGPPGCFFHKHPAEDFPGPVGRVSITESGGPAPYLLITEPGSLTAMAQMGVLEIHIWGSTWPDIERPDMVVFDLDPGPGVEWKALADGARLVRDVLRGARLESFVKTTGGKGLHVVAPLTPSDGWNETHLFCRRAADMVVELSPDRFTANMSKAKREGKMFVDYVRNNRGATSIAPFSTRAKEQATVAVPLHWSELDGSIRPDTFTVQNLGARLAALKDDPWDGYFAVRDRQKLGPEVRKAVGLG